VACVAAASVIAKVERDALMTQLHEQFPHYGWASNKGYGAKVHTDAITTHGLCDFHRKSWNLLR
jgi:ribonuclease HII